MLKSIHIKNFRTCKNVTIENMNYVTALVGRNASGKTNILRAIEYLAKSASTLDLSEVTRRFAAPTTMIAEIVLNGEVYRYTFDVQGIHIGSEKISHHFSESLEIKKPNRWAQILERKEDNVLIDGRDKSIRIGHPAPCMPALLSILPEDSQILDHVRPVLSFLRGVRYYAIDESNDTLKPEYSSLIREDEYQHWFSHYKTTGDTGDSVPMKLLHGQKNMKSRLDEISSLLGRHGLDLISKIDFKDMRSGSVEQEANGAEKYFHFVRFRAGRLLGGGDRLLEYDQLSLGTRRVLHLLTALLLDDNSLMLIEHPEDGVHRGLVCKIIGLLQTNVEPLQIIFTSHSEIVLNQLSAQNIRLLAIRRGATSVRALTPNELKVASQYIAQEGTLSEFLESVEA